jgi:hypothetical protein
MMKVFQSGVEMLDSQHSVLLFQRVEMTPKEKTGSADLTLSVNDPLLPAILPQKLVELIGIEPTTS